MGWKNAKEVCNELWDDFADRFNENIDKKIEQANLELEGVTAGIDPQERQGFALIVNRLRRDIEGMKRCKTAFPDAFKAYRDKHEAFIESKLLKHPRSRRRLAFVSTRNLKGLIQSDEKHPPRRKRKPSTKRRHVRTGRPKGWNLRAYIHAKHRGGTHIGVAARRKARRFTRKGFRIAHRANNLVRSARPLVRPLKSKGRKGHGRTHWKAYPLHRFPKRFGWLAQWLDGDRIYSNPA